MLEHQNTVNRMNGRIPARGSMAHRPARHKWLRVLLMVLACELWSAYAYATYEPARPVRITRMMGAPCTTMTDIKELGNGSAEKCWRRAARLNLRPIHHHKLTPFSYRIMK